MRGRVVAVEDQLGEVRRRLEQEGYTVVSLEQGQREAAAVVVSGMSDNILGIQDRVAPGNVIEARGMNADEIVAAVRRSVELQG